MRVGDMRTRLRVACRWLAVYQPSTSGMARKGADQMMTAWDFPGKRFVSRPLLELRPRRTLTRDG